MRLVMMYIRNKNNRGFTMLEVMISLLVLSIGILGYTAIQFHTINGRHYAKTINNALSTGGSTMDDLRLTRFSLTPSAAPIYEYSKYVDTTEEADATDYAEEKAYQITRTVTSWDAIGLPPKPESYVQQLRTMHMLTEWQVKGNNYSSVLFSFESGDKTGDD